MPHMPRPLILVSIAGLAALGACAGDDGGSTVINCEVEDRDEAFLAGMQKVGAGGTTFTLTSSTPAPPGRDDNTWVVDIATGAGPFDGAVEVTPFMPDHRHGTPIVAIVAPVAGTPGRYSAAPINLWMPGLWEITVAATATGGSADAVVFRFCIPG